MHVPFITSQVANRPTNAPSLSLDTIVKGIEAACKANDKETATKLLPVAFSKIDKSVSRGIQHRNTAARQKSRLASLVAAL